VPRWWSSKITSNGSHPWAILQQSVFDLAKNVFQVHAVDVAGSVVLRKRLRRGQVLAFFVGLPPCLIGLEACATAHHWARELIALGHETRLMPPSYVKAYVKRNKHDVADAEAICEAVRRPSMRFVPLKTAEQQSALMMHRARDLLIRQRTMLVNALRGHLAEFGLVEAQGLHKVARLIAIVMDEMDGRVPHIARQVLKVIVSQIEDIQTRIAGLETQVLAWHKSNPVSQCVWPLSRGSGRSSPLRSLRRLQIRTHSAVAESLPPGSG
jgi:transposase